MKKSKPHKRKAVKAKLFDPLAIGSVVLIRTITHYHVGRIHSFIERGKTQFVMLEDAAWIGSTGRFADCLKNGTVDESEPFASPVAVALASVIDVAAFHGSVPLQQK